MDINGMTFYTIAELSELSGKPPGTVKSDLHRKKVKPVSKNAIYPETALEVVMETPGKGRPPKQKT